MYYFLINPSSSSGKSLKIWQRTEELLQSEDIPYEAFLLSRDGEATVLARKLSLGHAPCTIIVIGGDGTVNQAVNGIRNFSQVTFGCIPSGSGNDFARGLHLPSSAEKMIRIALHPQKYRKINIGKITAEGKSRCFAVSAGMGLDAEICHQASRSALKPVLSRLRAGFLIYTAEGLKQLFTMKHSNLRIVVDGRQLVACHNSYFAAVMNLPYEGGGYKFCPQARSNDDLLDLCVIDRLPRPAILFFLPLAYLGRHTSIKGVQIQQCQKVTIQNQTPLCVHADGEYFGYCKKITVQPLAQKLTVIVG